MDNNKLIMLSEMDKVIKAVNDRYGKNTLRTNGYKLLTKIGIPMVFSYEVARSWPSSTRHQIEFAPGRQSITYSFSKGTANADYGSCSYNIEDDKIILKKHGLYVMGEISTSIEASDNSIQLTYVPSNEFDKRKQKFTHTIINGENTIEVTYVTVDNIPIIAHYYLNNGVLKLEYTVLPIDQDNYIIVYPNDDVDNLVNGIKTELSQAMFKKQFNEQYQTYISHLPGLLNLNYLEFDAKIIEEINDTMSNDPSPMHQSKWEQIMKKLNNVVQYTMDGE